MSKALLRFIRLSPTKARLIAQEVQGLNAESAIASLEFTPNKAAKIISKVIASAVANGGYDAQDVIITSCRVDAGPVLRRFTPRARGRATPIRKPTAHIFVEVGTQKSQELKKQKEKKASVDKTKVSKTQSTQKPSTAKQTQEHTKSTKLSQTATKAKSATAKVDSKIDSKTKDSKIESKPKATKSKVDSAQKKPANKKTSKGEE